MIELFLTVCHTWSRIISPHSTKHNYHCKVIYEMFHILNCGFWNQVSHDHRSFECNLSNCVHNCDDQLAHLIILIVFWGVDHCWSCCCCWNSQLYPMRLLLHGCSVWTVFFVMKLIQFVQLLLIWTAINSNCESVHRFSIYHCSCI